MPATVSGAPMSKSSSNMLTAALLAWADCVAAPGTAGSWVLLTRLTIATLSASLKILSIWPMLDSRLLHQAADHALGTES